MGERVAVFPKFLDFARAARSVALLRVNPNENSPRPEFAYLSRYRRSGAPDGRAHFLRGFDFGVAHDVVIILIGVRSAPPRHFLYQGLRLSLILHADIHLLTSRGVTQSLRGKPMFRYLEIAFASFRFIQPSVSYHSFMMRSRGTFRHLPHNRSGV
jgi:hypothetical protein